MSDRTHSRGAVVVISGPSGSGKTTLVKRLLDEDPTLGWSVSATTRPPRAGERDGRDYTFLSRCEFERLIDEGTLAEWAESYGHLYGTPAAPLAEALDAGRAMVLDVDVVGARQVREKFPEAVLVLIKPPDMDTLRERLAKRQSETEEQFRLRLDRANSEIACEGEYDHVIVNDDLERALDELRRLVAHIKETQRG